MIKNLNKIRLLPIFAIVLFLVSGCSFQKQSNETINTNNKVDKSDAQKNNNDIHSGLLLGLVKEPDLSNTSKNNTGFEDKKLEEYRTLWIYGTGSDIAFSEKKGGIITPYGDGFIKLTNNSIVDSTKNTELNEYSDNFYSKYSSFHNFSVILAEASDENKNLLNKDLLNKNYLNAKEGEIGLEFVSQTQSILYVGNKYACIRTSQYATGGGTLKIGFDDIKLYDIKNLKTLEPKRDSVELKSLLGNDVTGKLKPLSEKYNKTVADDKLISNKNVVDDKNLTLKRESGKWTVQAPLYEVYYHSGNGSSFNIINNLYTTDIAIPLAITSYDALCVDWNTIKSKIPEAKDAVSSPNKDMLVVLTPSELQVYVNPVTNGIDKPVKTIPVDSSEKIVLNQWATGDYVTKWSKILK